MTDKKDQKPVPDKKGSPKEDKEQKKPKGGILQQLAEEGRD